MSDKDGNSSNIIIYQESQLNRSHPFTSDYSSVLNTDYQDRQQAVSTPNYFDSVTTLDHLNQISLQSKSTTINNRACEAPVEPSATGKELFSTEASSDNIPETDMSVEDSSIPKEQSREQQNTSTRNFEYLFNAKCADPVLSNGNNNNTGLTSATSARAEYFSSATERIASHTKPVFAPHSVFREYEFRIGDSNTLEDGDPQDYNSLENYIESINHISGMADDATVGHGRSNNSESGKYGKNRLTDHEEKRQQQADSRSYDYCQAKSIVERDTSTDSNEKNNESLSSSQLISRDGGRRIEVKRIENGVGCYSQRNEKVARVSQSEILNPEANFQQDCFKKLQRESVLSESFESDLSSAAHILRSIDERQAQGNKNVDLRKTRNRDDRIASASESSKLSSLVNNLMSPDHQAPILQRPSGKEDFDSDMPCLPSRQDSNLPANSKLDSVDSRNDKPTRKNKEETSKYRTEHDFQNNGKDSTDLGKNNSDSRKTDNSSAATALPPDVPRQNGNSAQKHSADEENCSSSKHIYPWMKESRQNARRKQGSSSSMSSNGDKSSKRERTAYTNSQLVELEKEFHFNRYLCRPRRIEMAQMLSLTERQIKIWFQNRRMKYKKDQKLKVMPIHPLTRDNPYHHHHHHHSSSIAADARFGHQNDHRHYPHSNHWHPDIAYRSNSVDNATAITQPRKDCSSGGRCYGNGHHASHNCHGNNGRMTSPSSSSSTGTLSPNNGRSSGGFNSDVPVRSTVNNNADVQHQQAIGQNGCVGFPGQVKQTTGVSGSEDHDNAITEYRFNSESRRRQQQIGNHGNDLSLMNARLSTFAEENGISGGRSHPFNNCLSNASLQGQKYALIESYGRYNKEGQHTFPNTNSLHHPLPIHSNEDSNYSHYRPLPLESLTDCVQRSPEINAHQIAFATRDRMQGSGGGNMRISDTYAAAFSSQSHAAGFAHVAYERATEGSPLDFSSRPKNNSPKSLVEVYTNNRLTHL